MDCVLNESVCNPLVIIHLGVRSNCFVVKRYSMVVYTFPSGFKCFKSVKARAQVRKSIK